MAVVDPQLGKSQLCILPASMHDLGGLAALAGNWIPGATDPYEVPVWSKPADVSTHGVDRTDEDVLDNITETV
ncbi:MAG: hypothetical protein HN697_05590 [Actinobacteria bacterium]|jgi:hypothetical protein|nr:hypothetical protein [Actinomycetota bacterium]